MARPLREPLPVGPFLWWCHRRKEQIEREFDPLHRGGTLLSDAVHEHLLMEIGWTGTHDARRLWRWAFELGSGMVERSVVEDALDHAGVDFYSVYWELEPPKGYGDYLGRGRRMTDADVIAAHTVYWQAGLSLRELAELTWERFGYSGPVSCASQLRRAFVNLGLPRRSIEEANLMAHVTHGLAVGGTTPAYRRALKLLRYGQCDWVRGDGSACPRAAQPGSSRCGIHRPDEMARRRAQIAAVNAQGLNVLRWANREEVAHA